MRKAIDVSAADWRYQIHERKYGIYSCVLLRHFSGLEIHVEHQKKLGKRKTGVLKRMLVRDPVDLHFALSNIKQKLSGF